MPDEACESLCGILEGGTEAKFASGVQTHGMHAC
jgi:hypothetical protein